MLVYEFYWRGDIGDTHLLGILPERRKEPIRITDESIMNWVKNIIGDDIRVNDIFFCKVNIE